MQKIITLVITGAILYMIFQQSIGQIKTPEHLQNKPVSTEAEKDSSTQTEISGTFLEKTLSSVMVNVLKSDEGRMFMESMLQPMNKTVSGSGSGFKMNNDNFIQSIFKIKSFGEGKKGPVSCGHIVTVHYKILNHQNTVLDEKVVTFPLGSEKIAPGLDAVIVGLNNNQLKLVG